MAGLKTAKNVFKYFDLFSTSQFLRFQQDSEYKTASGGICSLIVIAIFIMLFMSTALQTINMQIITWSSSSELLFDPSQTVIPINPPSSPFMFAIKILGINLNNSTRYFDITMVQREIIDGLYEFDRKFVDMVPCTTQHFSLTEEIRKNTADLQIQQWLCPPIGYNFSIKGKFSSANMNDLEIRVTKCNATKDLSRPCASNVTIDYYQNLFQQFVLSLIFVNPLINPGDEDYLRYYIEDESYIRFTTKYGAQSNGHIEDYTIETDVSLLPFTENVVDSGVIIPQIFQNIGFQVTDDRYASFFFMKSAKSTTYLRSFNKLDNFFSYVGGLVGTILGLMFVVANFTSMAYELELSERICRYTEDKLNDFADFNLLSYFLFVVYSIGNMCGLGKRFTAMRQAQQCCTEVAKQLDVQLLLERLLFLQRATEALLDEHQLQGLHLHKLDTLKEIKNRRKRYDLRHQKDESDSDQQSSLKSQNNSAKSNQVSPYPFQTSQLQFQYFHNNKKKTPSIDKPKSAAKAKQIAAKILSKLREDSQKGNSISNRILSGIDETKFQCLQTSPNGIATLENGPINLKSAYNIEFQFLE